MCGRYYLDFDILESENFDSKNTATHSSIVINEVIRKIINFKGILISDDISMKSLKYDLNRL